MNKVPKPWSNFDVYCQLIPNEDERVPCYDVLPRLGAFEISTVYDNTDILFFSKQMSSLWPDVPSVAARLKSFVDNTKLYRG